LIKFSQQDLAAGTDQKGEQTEKHTGKKEEGNLKMKRALS
jgi:hypothetical protein